MHKDPKSTDTRVPYIQWHRSVHTVGSPHPDSQSQTVNSTGNYWKSPCMSRPVQLKPMFFNGHLQFTQSAQLNGFLSIQSHVSISIIDFRAFSLIQKEIVLLTNIPEPLPPHVGNHEATRLLSISTDLSILGISYKYSHTARDSLWLASFIWHTFPRFSRIVACTSTSLLFTAW